MKAVTGIEVLDRGLDGGFPRPSTILFFSEVIAEKRMFAEQFVMAGLRRDEVCLYVDFYRAPSFIRRELGKFGDVPLDKLVLVDATSAAAMLPSKEPYQIQDIQEVSEIMEVLTEVIRAEHPSRVVLDSLDFLTERFPKAEVLAFLGNLMEHAKEAGAVVGLLFMNWSYGEEELEEILHRTDYLVEFRTTLRGGVLVNKLRLRGGGQKKLTTNWIPFDFKELMGLVLHFPRILVTGPHHAGKSTTIQRLSSTAVSVDRMGTTIAFDFGSLDVSGVSVDLVGTPGQERFEFVFQIFAREVNGVMLVVDSTNPEDLPRAKEMRRLVGDDLPLVVLANKRDLPEALDLGELRAALELDDRTPIVEAVATEGVGLQEGLERLIELIIWGWPAA